MKVVMLIISALFVALGLVLVIRQNLDGIVVMIFGSLLFMLFASVKKWQYKADKSLYH